MRGPLDEHDEVKSHANTLGAYARMQTSAVVRVAVSSVVENQGTVPDMARVSR